MWLAEFVYMELGTNAAAEFDRSRNCAGRGNEGYDGEREPAVDWALTWRFRRLDCKQWEDWEVLRA